MHFMLALTYIPRPPLSDFVEMLWLYEDRVTPHAQERLLPTGTSELVIDLREEAIAFCGVHSKYFVIDSAGPMSVLGVHFKPAGAFPFLGLPAGELQDSVVSLETLWGAKASELGNRIQDAKTPLDKFRALERFLMAQATRPLMRHPAVAFALRQFQGVPQTCMVSDLAEKVGLSLRRFIQVFTEEVGLTPKLYCRIRRFQEVVRLLATGREFEWANVALACGYYDQAHFINDFRDFSGINPTTYLRVRGEHLNHVPLVD
jgi:AraC-like DNA-binding protein